MKPKQTSKPLILNLTSFEKETFYKISMLKFVKLNEFQKALQQKEKKKKKKKSSRSLKNIFVKADKSNISMKWIKRNTKDKRTKLSRNYTKLHRIVVKTN